MNPISSFSAVNKTLSFSARAAFSAENNALSRKLAALKRAKIAVTDLTISNPGECGLGLPADKILRALSHAANTRYQPDAKGKLTVRKKLAAYYRARGAAVTAEDILLTASTSEAYACIFKLLCNPGEEIFIPRPGYPLFDFLSQLNDISLESFPLGYDGEWHLDFTALKTKLDAKSKGIIVVNPNNPTGSLIQPRERNTLERIAAEQGLALISDEVFADFILDKNARHETFAKNRAALTFTLGGLSKTLALPQMKLGWIAVSGPAALKRAALQKLEIILDTYLSVNTPAQNAFPAWWRLKKTVQAAIKQRLSANLSFLKKIFPRENAVEILPCQAGWYAVLRLPRVMSEEEWVLAFLEKDHVYAHPGYFFDFEQEAYIVVSLLTREKNFQAGMRKISRRIANVAGTFPKVPGSFKSQQLY